MFRSAVSIPSEDKSSTYVVGGAEQIVLARQVNNEVVLTAKHKTSESVWRLLGADDEGRMAAVTGQGKPRTLCIMSQTFGTVTPICTLPLITGASALGHGEFFVATRTEICVLNEAGNIRVTRNFENPVTAAVALGDVAVVGVGRGLTAADLRESGNIKTEIADAHAMEIRSLDVIGNFVVTGCEEGVVKLWDVRNFRSGPVAAVQEAHNHWVTNLCFNRNQKFLLSAGADCAVTVWSFAGGKLENIHTSKMEDSVYGLAWSRTSDRHFLAASFDGNLTASKINK